MELKPQIHSGKLPPTWLVEAITLPIKQRLQIKLSTKRLEEVFWVPDNDGKQTFTSGARQQCFMSDTAVVQSLHAALRWMLSPRVRWQAVCVCVRGRGV